MTKSILLSAIILFLYFDASAQREIGSLSLVAQPQVFIPTSNIKLTNGISVGGYLCFEKMVSDKTAWLASFGGGLMQGKKYVLDGYEDTYPAITFMQLRGGVKYFIYSNHLWASGLIGAGQSFQKGKSSVGFSYSPAIGYAITDNFDVALRYDATSFSQYAINGIGFSLGYHFGSSNN